MQVTADNVLVLISGLAWPVYLALLLLSMLVTWRHEILRGEQLVALLSAAGGLTILWSLQAETAAGTQFHFLGITVVALMFGWLVAGLVALVPLGILAAVGQGDWLALPINGLLSGFLPAWLTIRMQRVVSRHLPPHFYIYIFVCGFIGAMLALAATLAGGLLVLDAATRADFGQITPFLPLLLFPEGVINGIVLTTLLLLKPEWVWTFDQRYRDSG